MLPRRATVLVLVPGRNALRLEVDSRWPYVALLALLMTVLAGAGARRCLDARSMSSVLSMRDVTGSLNALRISERPVEPASTSMRPVATADASPPLALLPSAPSATNPPALATPVALAHAIRGSKELPAFEPIAAWLRLDALHLGEVLRIKPFGDDGLPNAQAFAALRHLMRCRITGEEVPIEPRLVRILTQLSAIYDRPIQLVSGHRKPFVIGTKPTSQHALGRAADIRIAGVSIEELRSVAIRLGARGVGLYPEKGFVHVDVRDKPKYFWTYSEDQGEEADGRPAHASAALLRSAVKAD